MLQENLPLTGFDQMDLNPVVFSALKTVGYETPTPIQSRTIPYLMAGKDVLGQARTGTGKTAAFALPLLSRIDLENRRPQVLVLTPTRELAIQVADSFKTYGQHMPGLNVLPVYGGQSYGIQLTQLKRGVHVLVGTPGRLMDHLQRKTISLSDLFSVILDEADEMLHMGFIEDVEWILAQVPDHAQSALFSATMPVPIRKIAQKYLKEPEQVSMGQEQSGPGNIAQRSYMVTPAKKTEALVRILGALSFDGVMVFTRTKTATMDVAKALEARGFKAEALNGDMAQAAREQAVSRLKNGHIDILVATDVAARGLDVDRISHVVNYDMPGRVEPYIHRIGRTGRAGRTGEAILLLQRNEKWMLRAIEKTTGQKIREMELPTNADINQNRIATFKRRISQTLDDPNLSVFEEMIATFAQEANLSVAVVAAALAKLAHGDAPFLLPEEPKSVKPKADKGRADKPKAGTFKADKPKADNVKDGGGPRKAQPSPDRENLGKRRAKQMAPIEKGMERYRIEVGASHGIRPKDIVGAIANEAGLESKFIGPISIDQEFSFVDLPFGMPKNVYRLLRRTWVRSRPMSISKCA